MSKVWTFDVSHGHESANWYLLRYQVEVEIRIYDLQKGKGSKIDVVKNNRSGKRKMNL